ncbi:MAG: hypothetical protein IPI16_16370 [Comamonadaceae bacterium]|nr:hypothetical protein [Comamonadaceae bacterium]
MTVILSEFGALPVKAQRIAEILQDYDPTLELRWIPPKDRNSFDTEPFAVWHNPVGLPSYMIMTLKEDQLDHRVLAAIFNANNNNGNVLDRLEAEEAAKKLIKYKEELDSQEERREFSVWALRQNKTVKHNGIVYK